MADDRMERLLAALEREAAVRVAYLFGSRALGRSGPGSDWDVGALLAPGLDQWEALALADRLQSALGERVDLIDLRRAPLELASRILTDGRLLFARDEEERVELEARILARAHDMAPVLEWLRREILEERPHGHAVERHRATLGAAGRLRRTP